MLDNLNQLPEEVQRTAALAGINPTEQERSGSFFQQDQSILCAKSTQPGVEVLDIESALQRYNWLKDLSWKAVDPQKDEFTKAVFAEKAPRGYFMRSLPGQETIFPLQACLYLGQEGLAQKVHNIIIAEEGSHLHIITGCTVDLHVKSGLHIGISEFYVKKNASITFTMVHNWAEGVEVRPRSVAHVAEGGVFINNYICLKPVKMLQLYPTVHLLGPGSRTVSNSIVLGQKESVVDIGFRALLKAPGASAENVARAVARDNSKIFARGHMVGEVPDIKAHIECRGLVLSPTAMIHAVPELEARQENLEMSHEAAVGKIAAKEILYLMSRGLSADEATSAIIRGFLKVDLAGLPDQLKKEVDKLMEMELAI
jgi:Fe-S cluster assembly scaffold protein SufB